MQKMLSSITQIGSYSENQLYEHMHFKVREEFRGQMKEDLLNAFRKEVRFEFLREDKRWEELIR